VKGLTTVRAMGGVVQSKSTMFASSEEKFADQFSVKAMPKEFVAMDIRSVENNELQ
jgi:hypothetical protein